MKAASELIGKVVERMRRPKRTPVTLWLDASVSEGIKICAKSLALNRSRLVEAIVVDFLEEHQKEREATPEPDATDGIVCATS